MQQITIRIANLSNPLPRILQMLSQNCHENHPYISQKTVMMQVIPIQSNFVRKDNFIIIFDRVHISVHTFGRDPGPAVPPRSGTSNLS